MGVSWGHEDGRHWWQRRRLPAPTEEDVRYALRLILRNVMADPNDRWFDLSISAFGGATPNEMLAAKEYVRVLVHAARYYEESFS